MRLRRMPSGRTCKKSARQSLEHRPLRCRRSIGCRFSRWRTSRSQSSRAANKLRRLRRASPSGRFPRTRQSRSLASYSTKLVPRSKLDRQLPTIVIHETLAKYKGAALPVSASPTRCSLTVHGQTSPKSRTHLQRAGVAPHVEAIAVPTSARISQQSTPTAATSQIKPRSQTG